MHNKSIKRIAAIIKKESRHILRDPQTLFIVLMMPVIMMFIYGYALKADFREMRVAVVDPCQSADTRHIISSIDATTLFSVVLVTTDGSDVEALFKTNRIKGLVRFPADFSSALRRKGAAPEVQVLADGSDGNAGTVARSALENIIQTETLRILGIKRPTIISVHGDFLYNPRQESAFFFVPGLMVIILIMISVLLTSITITRERELGTLSQLLISPLRPPEIILGKLVPYIFLAALDAVLIVFMGNVVFGVRVAGSLLFLAGATFVYIITSLAIGVLISSIAKRQQHAMILALLVTLMPSILLSGFVFPVSSMPLPLQFVSAVIPATYFLTIVRGIMLKGIGLSILWQPLAVLSGMGLLFIIISIKKFKSTL
jgi:ABC-2 type transport system permease protein